MYVSSRSDLNYMLGDADVRSLDLNISLSFDATCVNTLRLRQNGRHFADDTFKCIFLNENVWNSFKTSLKFVPLGPINNMTALVQIMAWRRIGGKPLSETIMIRLPTHICVNLPQWVDCPACRTTLVATRFRVAVICPIIQVPHCIRVFFYFVWFVFINHIFQFFKNYVPIVTFWKFTYHKIWILSIMFCFIWSYWIIYFLACLEVSWRVVS